MKVGIIGYGKMGRLRHQIVEDSGRASVIAICDPYMTPAPAAGRTADVRADPSELFNDPTIDAVLICGVNVSNKPLTIEALRSGKHVFCEKPPALCADDVREVMASERASKRILMYGFNHRQHEGPRQMRRIVDSREYGRILWMRGRYGKSVDANYLETWRAKPELAGGGILLDQGIHMLDLFLFLGGGFDEVQGMVSSLYWEIPGIEDNVFAIMRNSTDGLVASLHSTMTQWRHLFSLEVFLERGYMALNGLKTSSETYGQEKLVVAKNRSSAPAATWEDEESFLYETDSSWEREVKQFFDAIQFGKPIVDGSSQHALDVMLLVDKIYENERHNSKFLYRDLNGCALPIPE